MLESLGSTLGAVLFVAAMSEAAVRDLFLRRIANRTTLVLLAGFTVLAPLSGWPLDEIGAALLASVIVFAGGLALFARGWLGGGDVKLASVGALWLGAGLVPAFIVATAVLGALLAMIHLARVRSGAGSREFAYGPAIAASGICLLAASPWGSALAAVFGQEA